MEPYRRILVPFDGSPLARRARSVGGWLAWRAKGQLDLVRVVPRSRPFLGSSGDSARAIERASADMESMARGLRVRGLEAGGHAVPGVAPRALVQYVTEHHIDIVVMGTNARPLVQRMVIGSVAAEVARSSPVPVLLVPGHVDTPRDGRVKILVALDETPLAERALDAALRLRETLTSTLTLFEVLPGVSPDTSWKKLEWYFHPVLGEHYLDDMVTTLAHRGVAVERAYSIGDPADEILQFAQTGQFDLIALATHGRTGYDRLSEGSVVDRVLRRSTVPVLVGASSKAASRRAAA